VGRVWQVRLEALGVRVLSNPCTLSESCTTTGSSDFCKSFDLLLIVLLMFVVGIGVLRAHPGILFDPCELSESCATTGSSDFCKSFDLLDLLLWIDCAILNKVEVGSSVDFESQGIDFDVIDE
jgi:hypothetical protein